MRRSSAGVVLVLVLGIAATGCSGGGKKSPAASPTTAASSATTTLGAIGGSNNPFCRAVQTFSDRFGRVLPALNDPQQFKAAVVDAGNALKDVQAAAPDSLKNDMALLNEYFQKVLVNLDLTHPDPTLLSEVRNPRYTQANNDLNNYLKQNCQAGG